MNSGSSSVTINQAGCPNIDCQRSWRNGLFGRHHQPRIQPERTLSATDPSAGQNASFSLTFTLAASDTVSGTITFVGDATNAPESATGTGTPSPQHSVSLSRTASTSTVVGYNVYRGTQSGGP